HRWLQARDFRWSETRQLAAGCRLRYAPVVVEDFDDDYRIGYLAGMTLGDGTFRYQPGWRSDRLGYPAAYWRVALADQEPLLRLVEFLARFKVEASVRRFNAGASARRLMEAVQVRSLARLAIIHALITLERDSRSYRRGFLGGFFDAEGYNGDSLRLSQVDVSVLERVQRYGAGLGFERRIMVKEDAPALLRQALAAPRWEPQVVALSGNTDCYQPLERRLGITRRCLEVFAEFRNPVSAITKSALVARDADLFT